ncbi:MAG: hypothetical protein BGO76_00060 [Caedibacter sp. 38-128]|nr:hypothetical protein [Holosporales bacterium]OJX07181.1 MAG: hypothetical protein BGO76_00060 [Caedibacter sp. 38-128]
MIIKNNRYYNFIFKYYEMMLFYFKESALSLLHILMMLSVGAIFQLLIAKTMTETSLHLYTTFYVWVLRLSIDRFFENTSSPAFSLDKESI